MVFPSVPIYLDHHTWLQQQDGDSIINIPPIVPTVSSIIGIDCRVGTRPSSMLKHGRIAKVPYAETPLKCPRCESTKTKFCYFNNYSLSQPRHFCKTCRRYWTRGGALRDVPVGGGCRRSSSKKSKGNQSKSPITLQSNPTSTTPTSPNNLLTNNKFIANSNLPIFSSMPNVCEMPIAGGNNELGFQIGKGSSASVGTLDLSAAFGDHWTSSSSHQLNSNQLSCFSGRFEQPAGAYNFNPLAYGQVGTRSSSSAALEVGFAQLSSSTILKHEEIQGSRNFQRFSGNDQYWCTGNTWRDMSGSSSASHFS